ncbi:hypothetical protein HXX76_000592 [Chlamydomonas incerta]|uniref:Major facilitator superfamily (MFS) profile domain-containing protein n=1 Tax=Chlamydomonas incerta TaxID=51695 RepID=A0A836B369_CHLIN|nr:hypothetical protein HXX76_000592 [Chlamydomonas incerta]|eukprot:KAG2445989.1 hypothetical protein HXX76_000592 [Chlamydomonas incerta]
MLTTPFTIGVFMVRDFEAAKHGGNEAEVDEQRVGRLTGLLAGIFSFSGFLTAYAWGCASNYVGRKPVIALGNAVSFISILWFGLSGSYASAMAARAFGGFLNGILGAWKCMIGESTDTLLQGKFFGYMSLAWGLGCIAGPAMGGAFSRPCNRAPHMPGCGEHGLFRVRPYFLACLVGSSTVLAAFLLSALMLEETLPQELQEKGLWAKLRRWRQGRRAAELQDQRDRRRLTSAEAGASTSSSIGGGGGIEGAVAGKAERRRRRRRKSRRCKDADAAAAAQGTGAGAGVAATRNTEAAGRGEEAALLLSSGACRSDHGPAAADAKAVGFVSSSSGSETDSSSLVDVDLHDSDVESGGRAKGARPGEAAAPQALQTCPSTSGSGSTNRMRHLLRLTSRTFISGNPFSRAGSWRRAGSGRRNGGGVLGSDAEEAASETEPWNRSPAASPRAGGIAATAAVDGAHAAGSPLRGAGDADGAARRGGGDKQAAAEAETEAVPLLAAGAGAAAVAAVAPAPSAAALELVPGCPDGAAKCPGHSHDRSQGRRDVSGSSSGVDGGGLSTAPGSASDCGSGDDTPQPPGAAGCALRGSQGSLTAAEGMEAPAPGLQQLKPGVGEPDRGAGDDGRSVSGGEGPRSGTLTPLATLHEDASHHGGTHGRDRGAAEQKISRHDQQWEQELEFKCLLMGPDSSGQRGVELELADAAGGGPGGPAAPGSSTAAPAAWYADRQVVLTILGYGATALLYCAVDEVFPIYAAAPLSSGGLGMREEQIAPPLMFFGAVLMPYSLYGYPWLQRKVGTLRLTRVGLLFSAATCLLLPLVADVRVASKAGALVLLYGSMVVKAFAQCSAFTGSIIAVNAAPSQEQLGAVNGVGQTLAALVRGVGPALGGILWAVSLGLHSAGQQFLTFVIIALIAVGNYFLYAFVRLPNLK